MEQSSTRRQLLPKHTGLLPKQDPVMRNSHLQKGQSQLLFIHFPMVTECRAMSKGKLLGFTDGPVLFNIPVYLKDGQT